MYDSLAASQGVMPLVRRIIPMLAMVAVVAIPALAQTAPLRDPTEPPAIFRSKPGAATTTADSLKPLHLVTVDEKRYVVWMGNRYGVGDSVQGGRIERIDESEVWLRSGSELRKLPVFAGVAKSPAAGTAQGAAPGATAKGKQ